MAMLRPVINDLSAGELSPLLYGRVDLPGYYKGAREITNFQVRPMGGVRKRAGTKYLLNTLSNYKARLIPFVLGPSTALLIEISATSTAGSGRIRLIGPTGTVLTGTGLPLSVGYLESDLFEIKYAQGRGEIYLVHPKYPPVWLRYSSGTESTATIEYTVSDQAFAGNLLSWTPDEASWDGYDLWEFTAQWMIPNKVYPASGTFGGISPLFAKRVDLTLYLSTTNTFPTGATTLVITRSGTYTHQGTLNIDVRPFIGEGNYPGAVAYFAGRLWMGGSINDPATIWASKPWDYKSFILCETLEYKTQKKIPSEATDHTGVTTYADGVGSTTVSSITPAIVGSVVGKYVTGQYIPYGATVVSNDTTSCVLSMPSLGKGTCSISFSVWKDRNVPEYEEKTDTTQQIGAGNAIQISLATEENENIQWIAGSQDLFIGTSSSEWIIPGGTTAVQARAVLSSRYGSADIQARFVGEALVYVTPSSRHIRQAGTGPSAPLTMQAEHMVRSGVTQLDYAQSPDVNIYAVLASGDVARCLIESGASVMAWDRIRVRTGDAIESVAIIPGADRDYVYLVVKRTIAGATVRFIEMMNENEDDAGASQWYLDAAVSKSGTAFTAITGLSHLEGQSISIRYTPAAGGDPLVVARTVSSGSVTIPSATQAIAGLPYTARLRLNRIDSQETEGMIKGIGRVFFRLYKSAGFTLRYSTDSAIPSIPVIMASDTYTGPLAVTTDIPAQVDAEIIIDSDDPVPCGIQTIVPDTEIGG